MSSSHTQQGRRLNPADISALKSRARVGENPRGAIYRLCTALQPASIAELIVDIWGTQPKVDPERMEAVLDGYNDWRTAGRPGMLR